MHPTHSDPLFLEYVDKPLVTSGSEKLMQSSKVVNGLCTDRCIKIVAVRKKGTASYVVILKL